MGSRPGHRRSTTEGRPGGARPPTTSRDRPWRPWWALALALLGLASLGAPLFIAVFWIVLDRDLDLGAVDGILAAFGWRGVVGSAVVALPWVVFLVRGGSVAFSLGLGLTVLGWAWVLWGSR